MAGLHAEGKPPFSHCLSDRSLQSIYDDTSMLTTSSWIKRAVPWLKEALSVWYIQWSKQVLILWKQHFLHLQPNDQQTFSKTCRIQPQVLWCTVLLRFLVNPLDQAAHHFTTQQHPELFFRLLFLDDFSPAVLTGDTPKDVSRPKVSRALLDMACSFRGVECPSG